MEVSVVVSYVGKGQRSGRHDAGKVWGGLNMRTSGHKSGQNFQEVEFTNFKIRNGKFIFLQIFIKKYSCTYHAGILLK